MTVVFRQIDRVVRANEPVSWRCDGCRQIFDDFSERLPVVISVAESKEGGKIDELDFCDDCLVDRAPALRAAGSTAPLITEE